MFTKTICARQALGAEPVFTKHSGNISYYLLRLLGTPPFSKRAAPQAWGAESPILTCQLAPIRLPDTSHPQGFLPPLCTPIRPEWKTRPIFADLKAGA